MLYKGHLATGMVVATTAVMMSPLGKENLILSIPVAAGASLITALLPDLDSSTSKISQKLPIIQILKIFCIIGILYSFLFILDIKTKTIIYNNFYKFISYFCIFSFLYISLSHRKLLHSLIFIFLLWIPINKYIGFNTIFRNAISMGLLMGIFAHLVGDCFTTDGCPLLYPLPIKIRCKYFKSGKDDKKIFLIILTICMLLLFIFKF